MTDNSHPPEYVSVCSVCGHPLVEALAALEHEQWVSWSRSLAATEHLSEERVERWRRLWVPYTDLSEPEKEADREWAKRVLAVLAAPGRGTS